MWVRSSGWQLSSIVFALLLLQWHLDLVAAQGNNASVWQTLSGNAPLVIAKGGFSGLFPDSSQLAYVFALQTSQSATYLWCDVQLTKDGVGVCLPDIKLDNCTDIAYVYQKGSKDYVVNGVRTNGWFSVDFTIKDLSPVALVQGIYSRSERFDSIWPIMTVDDVVSLVKPPFLWLNIEHDIFYQQHNLSMRTYVLTVSKRIIVNYVSSPEVAFLSSIAARLQRSKTKLVFRFLGQDITEPSTNQTYGSLLKNLTFVKTFASGILVPKEYIWPLTSDQYILPYTSVVMDAHKAGLEVYAYTFANDGLNPYNFSFDPLAQYLSFIDNGVFSVDGVLSDYPVTPSEAIGCFSHISMNSTGNGNPIIISHYGASGIYPDCTDLAYQKAVTDGADFIDCPVQVTSDGVLICMSSINLFDDTTVATSPFSSRTSIIPEIQNGAGIYTFNLTWKEIQTLKPVISAPEKIYRLERNPRYKNAGNFLKLSDFLVFAKDQAISGVLISIENAAFVAEKLGYSVPDSVISALSDAGYNNQTHLEVMIQSTNSSVLIRFKQQTNYNLSYMLDESIGNADPSSIADIKTFADSVAIMKSSIYPSSRNFITSQTNIVSTFKSAGLSVYVYLLRNEYVYQAWDFFSDPYVEINTFVKTVKVDGIITDFPGTLTSYKRSPCTYAGNPPPYMQPVQVGPNGLLSAIAPGQLPPALAPLPSLDVADVVEAPLPNVKTPSPPTAQTPAPPPRPSAGPPTAQTPAPPPRPSAGRRCTTATSIFISLSMLFGSFLFICV